MKIFKLFLVIFLISSFNHLEASNDDVKSKITKNLRCLVCQGQSVYDSDSEFAMWLLPILIFLIGGAIIIRNLILKKN